MGDNFRIHNGKPGIIESVNRIIRDATAKHASDIHIELTAESLISATE